MKQLIFITVFLIPLSAFAQKTLDFHDVSSSHPNSQAISYVQEQGIVEGYDDGTYKPESPINRAEFTKILIGASEFANDTSASNCFPDVNSEWFASYVCTAKSHTIIAGHPDGTFHPADSIITAEAAKIVVNTFGLPIPPGLPGDQWYTSYIAALSSAEALPVSAQEPSHALTRGEMAEIIWRVSQYDYVPVEHSSSSISSVKSHSLLPFTFPVAVNWEDQWGLVTVNIPSVYETRHNTLREAASFYEEINVDNIELREDDNQFGSYMRIHIPKGSYNPIDAKQGSKLLGGVNLFATADIQPVSKLHLQYYVRFPEGFDFSRKGQLPGIGGGIAGSEYGLFGSSYFGTNLLWNKDGKVEVYVSGRDGYVESSDPIPADNKWHKIDIFVELNTVTPVRLNGTIEVKIDDIIQISSKNAELRSGTNIEIEGVTFHVIYGIKGSHATSKEDIYVDIAEIRIDSQQFRD